MVRELEELNAIRLDNDLTFQAIADAITALGYGPLSMAAVQRMLRNPDRPPRERTLYKVRKFLAHLKTTEAGGRRPRTKARRSRTAGERRGAAA